MAARALGLYEHGPVIGTPHRWGSVDRCPLRVGVSAHRVACGACCWGEGGEAGEGLLELAAPHQLPHAFYSIAPDTMEAIM